MKWFSPYLLLLCAAVVCGADGSGSPSTGPRVFSLPSSGLVTARELLGQGDTILKPAIDALRAAADKLLPLEPASVMTKIKTAASGNKHDYFSFASYWWPDPTKLDGLPYVRRDGAPNPESRTGSDATALARTCNAVETLGLAYWFTGDQRHAEKAVQLIQVWFISSSTRMTPSLEHAQAIPGKTPGRAIGIIEGRYLTALTDGLALIKNSPAWTEASEKAMNSWLSRYFRWLTTSQNGKDIQNSESHHGTWYDVQAAHLALVIGKPNEAKKILLAFLADRFSKQINPDGSQAVEISRTHSFGTLLFNLEALMDLAHLGQQVGVDVWGYTTADGRSLRRALHYLAPYVDSAKKWPHHELRLADRARLLPLIADALSYGEDPQLRELLQKFGGTRTGKARWRLLWPASVPRVEHPG